MPADARRLADRLRSGGFAWLRRRLAFEWRTPTTGPGRLLLKLRLHARQFLRSKAADRAPDAGRTLYAFYDLQVAPITFDVLWFIVGAELRRRAIGLERIAFVVVPGTEEGVREEDPNYEVVVDRAARRSRLYNILLPAMSLLPGDGAASIAGDRAAAVDLHRRAQHVYPPLYDPALPIAHDPRDILAAAARGEDTHLLEAPRDARAHVDAWIAQFAGSRRLVTITLRHYAYGAGRNSDLDAWSGFARSLDPAVYAVCFVPDTSQSTLPPDPRIAAFAHLPEAAWNVHLRMALYERAYANLGVNTGPMFLAIFAARANLLMLKVVEETVSQSTAAYARTLGYEPGRQPPILRAGQIWDWGPDTESAIKQGFAELVRQIEQQRR